MRSCLRYVCQRTGSQINYVDRFYLFAVSNKQFSIFFALINNQTNKSFIKLLNYCSISSLLNTGKQYTKNYINLKFRHSRPLTPAVHYMRRPKM